MPWYDMTDEELMKLKKFQERNEKMRKAYDLLREGRDVEYIAKKLNVPVCEARKLIYLKTGIEAVKIGIID